MNDDAHHQDTKKREESAGVFKSSGVTTQRVDEFSGSAVHNVSVEQKLVPGSADQVFVGAQPADFRPSVYVGAAPDAQADEVFVNETAAPVQPLDPAEQAQQSLQQVQQILESVEQRKAELEQSYAQAEDMLREVGRIKQALTVNDSLRERIRQTVHRTKNIKSNIVANPSGSGEKK